VHGYWPLKELADRPVACGKVARGGFFFFFLAWNFIVTKSAVLREAKRTRPIMTLH
jgi:hypothetical protein